MRDDRRAPVVILDELGVEHVDAIKRMGDAFRKTLGMLPYPVFDEAADGRRLLAAIADNEVVGYALYRLPRSEVSLTHLCISNDWRGCGIAERLIERISQSHPARLGIRVKCRADYGLDGVWERLGFRRRAAVPGRSQEGVLLNVWWRDHGHPDLFTLLESEKLLTVALDVNVLLDLSKGSAERAGSDDSRVLTSDDLAGSIELVVLPELYIELDRAVKPHERAHAVNAATGFRCLTLDQDVADEVYEKLAQGAQQVEPGYPKSEQDRSDLRQLAQAIAAGVDVFTTKDAKLVRTLSQTATDIAKLRVLHPVEVILQVEELQKAAAYQPAQLLGTSYEIAPARAGLEPVADALVDRPGGEAVNTLKARMRKAVKERGRLTIISDEGSTPVASFYAVESGTALEVDLVRVSDPRRGLTLARQLLFLLRKEARRRGCDEVRIVDPCVPQVVQQAAEIEDFRAFTQGSLSCAVIDYSGKAIDVQDRHQSVLRRHGSVDFPQLTANMSAVAAARIEKMIWPAKLLDSELPSFIVPIRPQWSSGLFGEPAGLFERPSDLGISMEHVYYRKPRPRAVSAPARVLWYRANTNSARGAVIGESSLDEVMVASAARLHERFSHLGVYTADNVKDAADSHGLVQALRFSKTSLFDSFVSLDDLEKLVRRHGGPGTLQGPQRISAELFSRICAAGRGQHVGGSV